VSRTVAKLEGRPSPLLAVFRDLVGGAGGGVGRNAFATLAMRVGQVGLEFLVGLLAARLLGASSYGAYAFALAWVGLLGIPAAAGFDRLLIREIAVLQTRADWPGMRGILARSNQIAGLLAVLLALAAAGGAALFASRNGAEMTLALQLGMLIVPIVAIVRLRQAALQGLGHVALGQMPETIIQPALLLLLFAALALLPGLPRTGPVAVGLYALAAAAACAVGMQQLRQALPRELAAATATYQTRLWLRRALPFVWILGMNVLMMHTDVILLGLMAGPDAAGIYRAASQMANLVAFPLTAVQMAFAPVIARLYERGEQGELQRRATAAARMIIAMALPIAVLLALFGGTALRLFGPEFAAGSTALAILSGAYLLNAAMGTSGYLLIMTKHETEAAVAFAASAGLNLLGNLLLIPFYSVNGAAAATGLSIVAVSVAFAMLVRQRLGIRPTAFAPTPGDA